MTSLVIASGPLIRAKRLYHTSARWASDPDREVAGPVTCSVKGHGQAQEVYVYESLEPKGRMAA